MSCKSERADSKESAGAPEDEIEVTPEMIEAGAIELASFNSEYESREDKVIQIFKAMIEASHR